MARGVLTLVSSLKIILEKHDDGYVAHPVGMRDVVVGEGDTYDDALTDSNRAWGQAFVSC